MTTSALSAFLWITSIISWLITTDEPPVNIIPTKGAVWRMAVHDLDADEQNEIILGMYDGTICCITETGQEQWSYQSDGFPFSLTTADLDADGSTEVVVATSAGSVIALSAQGKVSWRFRSQQPMLNVSKVSTATGRDIIAAGGLDRKLYLLDANGNLLDDSFEVSQLIHRMIAADLDNDASDEILLLDNRNEAYLLGFEEGKVVQHWKKVMKVPEQYINWENPRGRFYTFSLATADLNADQNPEIVMGDTYFNKQPVMATDAEGNALWVTKGIPFKQIDEKRNTEFFSMTMVQTADLIDSLPGDEILALAGGTFRLIDGQGTILEEAEAAIGFTDIKIHQGKVYLGSSPNGDENIYVFDWDKEWKQKVEAIQRTGKVARIESNIKKIKEQIAQFPQSSSSRNNQYLAGFGRPPHNHATLVKYQQEQAWWKQEFPYENLHTATGMKIIEPTPPLDENGQPWSARRWQVDAIQGTKSVDSILAHMAFLEENSISTRLTIGHSVMPFITLETAQQILQTAPNATYGFYTAEDEQFERLERYYKHYFQPLASLCRQYDKYCVTKNKNVWWINTPAHPELTELLFNPGNEEIIKAATEDSNSRTPEINLMGRLGLYLSNKVAGLITNVHRDMFSFNRYHEWEYPKHGHPYLRLMIAHTLLGADEFNLRYPFQMEEDSSYRFTQIGAESVEPFFHLMGKEIIWKPTPEEMAYVSSLGIAMHPPSEKWIADGINGHRPEQWVDDPELTNAVIPFNGTNWGMLPTPEHALQKVLFNKQYQFGAFVPATPYGLVPIVPSHFNLDEVPHITSWLHTDGTYLWEEGGSKLQGKEAAELVKSKFEVAAQDLPFRARGNVFCQILKKDDQNYRIVLIDPGWINPADHSVRIDGQLEGNWSLTDVLSGEQVKFEDELIVPAGAFRMIDAHKTL